MRAVERYLLAVWLALGGVVAAGAEPPQPPAFPFDAQTAREYQRAYAESLGLPVVIEAPAGLTLVLVPPGAYLMGSPTNEPGRNPDERQHEVTLTRGFYLGKHEVTREQFALFVTEKTYTTDVERAGGGNAHDEKAVWQHRPGTSWRKPGYAGRYEPQGTHPVVHVSHTDARRFCEWLGALPKQPLRGRYRLPTEGEWEWACRAGTATRFWWGDELDESGKVANVGDRQLKEVQPQWPRSVMPMNDGHAFPAPAGSYRPNAFGLHDMIGNVWEFCSTRHGAYSAGPATDPGDLGEKESYDVRGGGWSNVAADCRSAMRNADPPHFGHSNLGFRVVLELAERPK